MSRTSSASSARILLVSLTLIGCASSGRTADPGRPPVLLGLPGIVDSVRNTPPLNRTYWGVGAYDYAADRMLVRVNVDRHFIPASNMKLVVTAVALDRLGPDFRYMTSVFAEGLRSGTATALVVKGTGDPTLSERFHGAPLAALAALADSIVQAGVRHVDGPLVVDATYFDAQHVHSSWEIGDLNWSYAAPVAAFAVEEGTLTVIVQPGASVDDTASIDLIAPRGVIEVDNSITTDTAFSENTITFLREPGTNAFHFTGRIPVNADPDVYHIAVHEPARFAAASLQGLLRERGVEVTGSIIVVDHDSPDAASGRWNTQLGSFQSVAAIQSPPLSQIVEAVLEPSQNWIAEQLVKTLGAEHGDAGTWEAGLDVERRWLIDVVGIDSTSFRLVDGSGLSVQNLLTPDAIMRLLFHATESEWGGIYRAAMPEPGEDESTLENRLAAYSGRVFAKTGSITNVNSLSGYLVAADGRQIIFSILTNASGVPASFVRTGIDQIVAALAAVGTPAPAPVPERRLSP